MPIRKLRGIPGLPGLSELSEMERKAFYLKHEDKLKQFASRPMLYDQAAETLYNNQLFKKTFGKDAFKAMDDGSEEAYNARLDMLKEKGVQDEWNKRYSPINEDGISRDNTKGLGSAWEKYSQMSSNAKLKLMDSEWETNEDISKRQAEGASLALDYSSGTSGSSSVFSRALGSPGSSNLMGSGTSGFGFTGTVNALEATQQYERDQNNKILEHIYSDDADQQASSLSTEVVRAYDSSYLSSLSDEQIKEDFREAVTPDRDSGNLGIPEYAAYFGRPEMKDFSIDEMRQVLAKKAVYDKYLGREMAATALSNEAKRYINNHQGAITKFGLWAKDVGISVMSYTADKFNSIYNVGLAAADLIGDKPTVLVDDEGNIVDYGHVGITTHPNGTLSYVGEDGEEHPLHREQVSRTTLHNMGKNFDGSEDNGILNPQYWTRAEQFGTLDSDAQKQWEKLGASPHKIVYNPNEESNFWYDATKMVSFGIADASWNLIPFGIGIAGRALSTANKVGNITRGFGKAVDFAGKALTSQTRFGQIAQGLAGAGGIGYAYQRGAFQETLAENYANMEESILERNKRELTEQYQNDKDFHQQVDVMTKARASEIKADYLAEHGEGASGRIVDEKKLDEMIYSQAQASVFDDLLQERVKDFKKTPDYATMQEAAINSAGNTAVVTFFPEAVKYGLVNTLGFRKFLYTNPAGLTKRVSPTLKGLKETTNSVGKERLATEPSKFLTRKDKIKQFGKVLGSQMWGGAWTNGTDDMMVDAAERINADSFGQYLSAYREGDSMSDTYNFADGLYSYWKGLNNSLGQETTWRAGAIGGAGSVVSIAPHMTNILHYFTKEGRQAYRDRYQRRPVYETDEKGFQKPVVDENGKPVTKKIKRSENWRDRFNYFIQNGVLNTYYGAKIDEQSMQEHADYVNAILDDTDDFKAIEDLIASDIGFQNAEDIGDQKTMRFINAIRAMTALNRLGNNDKDPATLSSVVQNAKSLIERAARMTMDENQEGAFTEEEISNLLSQYYSSNPELAQTEYNNQLALYHISENAQELLKASEAYDKAEKQVQSVEKSRGKAIDPAVREKMKMEQALNGHWQQRLETMKDELDDTSSAGELSEDMIIPTLGGRKNAESLIKVYDRQQKEITKEREEYKAVIKKAEDNLDAAQKKLQEATTSEAQYNAQKGVEEAQAELEDARQQDEYLTDLSTRTAEKQKVITNALKNQTEEESNKILTVDDIMSLDPVTRARMLRPENKTLYNKEQQREIEKLEQRLLMRDGDALQKIQDIALLTQRIQTNMDAYSRMAKNPEAAAVALENQRMEAANIAYKLSNQKNAETIASFINEFDEGMKTHPDVTQEQKEDFIFKALRKFNPTLLSIIDEDKLLPNYQAQVANAKEWAKVLSDIDAVISSADRGEEWEDAIRQNLDIIVEPSNTKDEIISRLEEAIDNGYPQAADFDKILSDLTNLGYQRNSTVIEKRKEKKEREEAERQRIEAEKQKAEAAAREAAKAAAEKAAQEQQAKLEISEKEQQKGIEEGEDVELNFGEEETATKPQGTKQEEKKSTVDELVDLWEIYAALGTKDIAKTLNDVGYQMIEIQEAEKAFNKKHPDGVPKISEEEAIEIAKKFGIYNKTEGSSVTNTVKEGHDDAIGDYVEGHSPSVSEEAAEGQQTTISSESTDVDALNDNVDKDNDSNPITLSGNAMAEYEPTALREHRLVHKKGAKPDDSMSKFYSWMDSAGVKLQNIIDDELPQILANNSHTKIKFMRVRPTPNATHDEYLSNTLLLVVDYDNAVNKSISSIHNEDNGGVIDSAGKKYLIVGILGYGNSGLQSERGRLWQSLNNAYEGHQLPKVAWDWFKQKGHEAERFYVHDGFSTEIVPGSMIPGWIIRQNETDEFPQSRKISELLNDETRNPHKLKMNSLGWSIIEYTQDMDIKNDRAVMHPQNRDANAGRLFALIPAGNGKLLAAKMDALFYNDEKFNHNSELYQELQNLFMQLAAPKYEDRYDALLQLFGKLYITPDGHNILLAEDGNGITFKRANQKVRTVYTKAPNFDTQELFAAIAEWNPRINITPKVLFDAKELQKYDEAGALMTDLAKLGTAGVNYSVYAIDADGNMIIPKNPEWALPKADSNSDYRDVHRLEVPYLYGESYIYNRDSGTYTKNGVEVTNEGLIKGLDYARRIIDSSLIPVKIEGVQDYYVLSEGEHPEVIRQNNETRKIEELSREEAVNFIKEIEEEKAAAAREAALQKKLGEDASHDDFQSTETVEIKEEEKKEEPKPAAPAPKLPSAAQEGFQTFSQVIRGKSRAKILDAIKNKMSNDNTWADVPIKSPKQLTEYLMSKGLQLDMIPVDEAGLDAWIQHNIICK